MEVKRRKRILIKLLISIMLAFGIISAFAAGNVKADAQSFITDTIGVIVSGVLGILFIFPIITAYLILFFIHTLISGLAYINGATDAGLLYPQDIFFNKVPLTNIDFYNFSSGGGVATLRDIVAKWFVVLNGIAMLALIVVLIYLAIRMLMEVAGDKKARYKEALTDWGTSVALLFVLQVYIVGLIKITGYVVSIIEKMGTNPAAMMSFFEQFNFLELLLKSITLFIPGLFIYGFILRYTVAFFFQYIKRMFKVAFLIMVAPLITITYAIDKFKDGKAQAFEKWMKEFTMEVIIQPFHAMIYFIVISMALSLGSEYTLASGLIAIMGLRFMKEAEGLVKGIFNVSSSHNISDGNKIANVLLHNKLMQTLTNNTKGLPPVTGVKPSTFNKFANATKVGTDGGEENQDLSNEMQGSENQNNVSAPNVVNAQNLSEEELEDYAYLEDTKDGDTKANQDVKLEEKEVENLVEEKTTTKTIEAKEQGDVEIELPKEQKRFKDYLVKDPKFGFALAGASWEAGDASDSIIKNVLEGWETGAGIGDMAITRYGRAKDKYMIKAEQKENYSSNMKIAAKELGTNVELAAALKDMPEMDNATEEGRRLINEFIDKIVNSNPGDILSQYNARRMELINSIKEREKISTDAATTKVDYLQESFLALGKNANIHEYDNEEVEFLSSMINAKIVSEKEELETSTNYVDEHAFDNIKAMLYSNHEVLGEGVKPENIISESEYNTKDLDGTYTDGFIEAIREKDKQLDGELAKLDGLVEEYDKTYGDKEALEKTVKEAGKDADRIKRDFKTLLGKIAATKKKIELNVNRNYRVENGKLNTPRYRINVKEAERILGTNVEDIGAGLENEFETVEPSKVKTVEPPKMTPIDTSDNKKIDSNNNNNNNNNNDTNNNNTKK